MAQGLPGASPRSRRVGWPLMIFFGIQAVGVWLIYQAMRDDGAAPRPAAVAVPEASFAAPMTQVAPPDHASAVSGTITPSRIAIDPATVMSATKPGASPGEAGAVRETVRQVLREELGTYLDQRGASDRAASAPINRPPHSHPVAVQRSNEVVDRAIATGVWTDADNSALLRNASRLSEADRVKILDKIFGAINSQRLKPEGAMPSL